MSDTIRNILLRAARAESVATQALVNGYDSGGLDSGDMEEVTAHAYGLFTNRILPDMSSSQDLFESDRCVHGNLYLSALADRALAALDALDTVIETVDRRDLLEQEFIKIRALLEELAPREVPVVVPAPDVVPVQEPLAFPDAVK